MSCSFKKISTSKLLQISLIVDSLAIHFQTYLSQDQNYLIIGLGLALFHIVIFLLEHICRAKFRIIFFVIVLLKGIAQLLIMYIQPKEWALFAGIQIVFILRQNHHFIQLGTFIFFLTEITVIIISFDHYLVVGLLRCVINFFIISCLINQRVEQNLVPLKTILSFLQYEEFCLLDDNFKPIIGSALFQSLLKEQLIQKPELTDKSRLFTPRDNNITVVMQNTNNNYYQQNLNDCLFNTILFQIKKKQLILKNDQELLYEIQNLEKQHYISIKKIILECEEYIMIIKHKYEELNNNKQADKVKIMINTVHKVSHDMRNPLNAIINMQLCLQDQIDPNLVQKYLKPSLNSCHLLLNLVNDILDAAQIENKTIRLVFRRFNLEKLIQKTISLFDLLKEKKELKIIFNYDYQLPVKINSDKLRIRQIVMNLLSNAIKYTQTKGTLLIECLQSDEDSKIIIISIQDSGMGIKPENLKLLFQEFSKIQDEENFNINPTGIGLGLKISNELAKLLVENNPKGVQVQSEYGKGSKFFFEIENQVDPPEDIQDSINTKCITNRVPAIELHLISNINQFPKISPTVSIQIPMLESTQKILLKKQQTLLKHQNNLSNSGMMNILTIKGDSEKVLNTKLSNQGKQIQMMAVKWLEITKQFPPVLIVDDNEFNIMVLQYLLEQFGIASDSAMSGMISIQKFQERLKNNTSYQLIFMDIEMPLMDGYETACRLLKLDPQAQIVACSAYKIDNPTNDQQIDSGMIAAVEKPITKIQLKELLYKISDGLKSESIEVRK